MALSDVRSYLLLTKPNYQHAQLIPMNGLTRVCKESERYWRDNKNVLDPVSLDVSEELLYFELFHKESRDPFEHGNYQARRNAIDMTEWSRIESNAWFILKGCH